MSAVQVRQLFGNTTSPSLTFLEHSWPSNLPEWDPANRKGGNPQEINVNAPFNGIEVQYIYQVIMGMLVLLIVPGIGLLYGGMARRKSALAMIFQSMTVMAVVTFQW